VQKPGEIVRKLCAFVGENFEPVMLAVDKGNSSFQVDEK
jgi:hypothetical protein